MAVVKISKRGEITIPTRIRKKYHIKGGTKVSVGDENGVITIRPTLNETIRFARKNLERGA